MKYCTRCGNALFDEAAFCPRCGSPCGNPIPPRQQTQINPQELVKKLSEKVKINGILWLVIGALQAIIGIYLLTWRRNLPWVLIVGAINIVVGIADLKYSSDVLACPKGVVKRFEPLAMPIITLVYNLIFGGVIGCAGSIYYLVAIRSFVMENKDAFLRIEESIAG